MKKWKQLVSGILSVCLLIGLALPAAALPASSARQPLNYWDFLSVEDGKLVNRKGETVVLRGVNLGGWLIQESWMCPVNGEDRQWANLDSIAALQNRGFTEAQIQELFDTYQDNWITEYDLDLIAETGANVVRVPFWYRNFMTSASGTWINENPDENPGFLRLDWVIEECKERGMYVILDMHGCPGGQSKDHCCGTLGKNELYTNTVYQEAMKSLWAAIAERYKDEPAVAAYDVMNEPQNNAGYDGPNNWDPYNDPTSWELSNKIYAMMIPVIREQDPDHVITIEGIWSISNLPDPAQYGWTNMMYQLHLYNDNEGFQSGIDSLVDVCNRYGVAGYVGEFSNLDGIAICEQSGISWTTWTYKAGKQVGGWGWFVSDLPIADTTSDSFETIKQKWGSALRTDSGNFQANDWVIDAVRAAAYVDPDDSLVESWTRYEAEKGEWSENAKLNTNNENFSGRQFIGNLNTDAEIQTVSEIASDWSNVPYVKFTVTVPEAGVYRLRIGYATTTTQVIAYLRVGDQPAESWERLALPSTGGWQTVQTRSWDVELPAGTTVLWLTGSTQGAANDNWINYDYIDIGKPKPAIRQGDVNQDGFVNSSDARMVLQATVDLRELTIDEQVLADMDVNGQINSSDARLILQTAVSG